MEILYRLLPHRCPLCLAATRNYICEDCKKALPKVLHPCRVCGLPLHSADAICGDCLRTPKPYELTLCPLQYQHPVDHLIHQFKHRSPYGSLQALLPPLVDAIREHYSQEPLPSWLIPVPCDWSTRLLRGYNQAHVLAQALSDTLGIPLCQAAQRSRTGRRQKNLGRNARFTNLRYAFTVPPRYRRHLTGSCVALVDDVVTTCATVSGLTRTLKQFGVEQVHVWALARTPKT